MNIIVWFRLLEVEHGSEDCRLTGKLLFAEDLEKDAAVVFFSLFAKGKMLSLSAVDILWLKL